jgi:NTP pyrophosphatase (non-canonical NTP hydrolase)
VKKDNILSNRGAKNLELKELQKKVFEEYKKNGYLLFWTYGDISENDQTKSMIAELGMINTEISEAIEKCFRKDHQNIGFECADIIIRTLNFMSRLGLDAEFYIERKNNTNFERGYLHGKR